MFRLRPTPDPLPPRADGSPAAAPRLALRLLLAPVLAGAVLSTQAAALPMSSACQDEVDLGTAFDLGNGLVAQRWATDAFALTGALGVHVAHCPSDHGIHVTAQVWNEHGRLPDTLIDPVAILEAAAQSPQEVTFAELVDRFRAAGLNARGESPSNARCACAVFYPGTPGAGQ